MARTTMLAERYLEKAAANSFSVKTSYRRPEPTRDIAPSLVGSRIQQLREKLLAEGSMPMSGTKNSFNYLVSTRSAMTLARNVEQVLDERAEEGQCETLASTITLISNDIDIQKAETIPKLAECQLDLELHACSRSSSYTDNASYHEHTASVEDMDTEQCIINQPPTSPSRPVLILSKVDDTDCLSSESKDNGSQDGGVQNVDTGNKPLQTIDYVRSYPSMNNMMLSNDQTMTTSLALFNTTSADLLPATSSPLRPQSMYCIGTIALQSDVLYQSNKLNKKTRSINTKRKDMDEVHPFAPKFDKNCRVKSTNASPINSSNRFIGTRIYTSKQNLTYAARHWAIQLLHPNLKSKDNQPYSINAITDIWLRLSSMQIVECVTMEDAGVWMSITDDIKRGGCLTKSLSRMAERFNCMTDAIARQFMMPYVNSEKTQIILFEKLVRIAEKALSIHNYALLVAIVVSLSSINTQQLRVVNSKTRALEKLVQLTTPCKNYSLLRRHTFQAVKNNYPLVPFTVPYIRDLIHMQEMFTASGNAVYGSEAAQLSVEFLSYLPIFDYYVEPEVRKEVRLLFA